MSYNPAAKQATAANTTNTNALASSNDATAAEDANDVNFDVFWAGKSVCSKEGGAEGATEGGAVELDRFAQIEIIFVSESPNSPPDATTTSFTSTA